MKTIQITQTGFTNLQEELKNLQEVKRPLTIDKLQKARSMGDLKENNAYHAAREELGELEGRVLEIKHILQHAQIVLANNENNQISLGKTIVVDAQGTTKTFQLVGEFEADPMNGKISQTSPIGKTLIGKKEGEAIEIVLPGGKVTYKILSVK